MSVEAKVETKGFSLPKKDPNNPKKHVIRVVPIKEVKERNGELMGPQHQNNFLFKDAKIDLPAKYKFGNQLRSPLTQEEAEFFEDSERSGLPFKRGDLSVHKKEDNFWDRKEAKVTLRDESLELDLTEPMDYIKYKVLLSNSHLIAPDPEAKNDHRRKPTHKYELTPYEYKNKEKVKTFNDKKEIYKFLGTIQNDAEQMINFLMVFDDKKTPSPNSDVEFLIGELETAAEEYTDKFVEVMEDKDRNLKATIRKAEKVGALIKEGRSYELPDGEQIANNFGELLKFLKDPKNQGVLDVIEARVQI